MPAWNKTAAQLLLKKTDFLRDCALLGMDVTYTVKETAGTFDPLTDTYSGSTSVSKTTIYSKAILIAPIEVTGATVGEPANVQSSTKATSGFALGYRLGDIDLSSTLVGRLKTTVPLTQSAVYTINGMNYKLKRVIENAVLHKDVPLWNVVMFIKA